MSTRLTIKAMTLFLAILTTASAWAGNKPKFCLDFCEGGLNNILITGWAFDPDVPAASIEIHVYIYTDASCSKQYEYTAVSIGAADVPRPDVNAAYNITGNHGFQTFIPIDDVGTYYVRVYALDASGDSNPLMNNPYTAVTVTTHEGIGTSSNPFTIGSKEDWDLFAQLTTDPGTAFYYRTCSYKMTADVGSAEDPVTTMWSYTNYPFSGTFDGDGKTLCVNIVTDEPQAAPFHIVGDATIKNLYVVGLVAVNTDTHNNHAGGLVGYCKEGTTIIDGCYVATRVEAKMYCGGIVGHGGGTGLIIRNSVFSGSIAGFTKCAGGLVGWCDWLSMNLINCLTTGTFEPGSGGFYHPIALTNNSGKAHANAEGVYYSNAITPTAQTNLVPGGTGIALNETRVPGEWTTYVIAVDGNTWYAAGSDGVVAVDDGGKDFENWSSTPGNPVGPGEHVTLTYSGPWDVKNISAIKQWYGDLADLNGNITVTDGMVLSGKLNGVVKVSIADGATVTLRDMDIQGGHNDNYVFGGINCEGNATIVLSGTNFVRAFHKSYPAIYIPEGKTLTIRGNGSLEVHSNGTGAGIGGGDGINCGNIVIESGTIEAHGGDGAAAIGGGSGSKCGTITISTNVNTVAAYKNNQSPYSIGPGKNGTCGTFTIGDKKYDPLTVGTTLLGTGTTSTAAAFTSDTYIPLPVVVFPGETEGTWTFTMPASDVVVSVDYCNSVTFAEGTVDVAHWSITPDNPVDEGTDVTVTYTGTKIVESVTALKPWYGDLADVTTDVTVTDGMTLTGKLGAYVKVSIADRATVKLQDVTIEGKNWAICPYSGITCEGDATLILSGTNYVKGFHGSYPGIFVPEGKTLTIRGNGSLEVLSSGLGSGIGGGYYINCGNIVIEGGTIFAHGGSLSAAIGGGFGGSCGNITITDQVTKVTVQKEYDNAPYTIGPGNGGSCGNVTIGGQVTGSISDSPYTYTGKGTSTSEMPKIPSDALPIIMPHTLPPGETAGTWTFTMPNDNVELSVEYSCDVNNDGNVDVADIAAIIDVMAGNAPELEYRADVNGDDTIDVADIARIIDKMANSSRRELRPTDSE